ncbi:hypothetical protein [Streptomyces sp. NPDC001070]
MMITEPMMAVTHRHNSTECPARTGHVPCPGRRTRLETKGPA